MRSKKAKRTKQTSHKFKLQNEIDTTSEDTISATFEISSNPIQIPLHNLVKYSTIVQENIKHNDIFTELNNAIQKVKIENENSIQTFLQLLDDGETDINNDEFADLLKLSEAFKVEPLKNVLKKYLHNHSKDIDFILKLKIEQEKSKDQISILNDDISSEMEECLKSNINECLQNDKINQIPVSSIYRMIEHSSREQLSNDLLFHFIIKSIKERHSLFHFIDIVKLSNDEFEEMMKIYERIKESDNNQTHYFDFLPNNLSYINKLREKQKLLEKRIVDLEKMNENLMGKNKELTIINQEHVTR